MKRSIQTLVGLAVLAMLTGVACLAHAKCNAYERTWKLELRSVQCMRDGVDCATEDTAASGEADQWQSTGTLTNSPDSGSIWLIVRMDGQIRGPAGTESP